MSSPELAREGVDRPGGHRCLLLLNGRSRSGAVAGEPIRRFLASRGVELAGGGPVPPEAFAAALARQAPHSLDRVLVGGGDGTLNAALPELLRAGAPIGVIPLGTANDFAGALGIPGELRAALRVALDGRPMRVDVGRVNGRPFLNVASIGLGATVTENLSAELKARLGFLGYPHAMLSAFRKARPFRVRVCIDDHHPWRARCIHLAVGNGPRYGGGALIAEDARLDDGRLHVFALAPVPLWRLLLLAPWLGRGRQRELADARAREGRWVRVTTSRPLPVSADGEMVSRTPAVFDLLPGALSVLVPERPAVGGRAA
jgi:YegS/Rv2252/BmrU family lipid kinase